MKMKEKKEDKSMLYYTFNFNNSRNWHLVLIGEAEKIINILLTI